MRSFDYGPFDADTPVKIVGNACTVEFDYTDAVDLLVCVKAGRKSDNLTELKTIYGVEFTRVTLTGTGSDAITIDGLTPGLYVAGNVISGTGTLLISTLTGSER